LGLPESEKFPNAHQDTYQPQAITVDLVGSAGFFFSMAVQWFHCALWLEKSADKKATGNKFGIPEFE